MTRVRLKGINRIKAKLADGSAREYHYVGQGRGAGKFWESASDLRIGSPEYIAAFTAAAQPADQAAGKFRSIIVRFLESQDFKGLAPRTQKDMRCSIFHAKNGIDKRFGDAPIAALNDTRIRTQALDWRDSIGGKVGGEHIRHLQRIMGFALDRGLIREHHLRQIKGVYKSSRSDIFWMPEEVSAFVDGAPKHIGRILIAATETGLRPDDLATITRANLHPTPHGQRLVVFTAKRKRIASIPVTDRMSVLIAETPDAQSHLIATASGQPYKHANYLGDAVSEWRDRLKLRPELRLYDARGTAATRHLEAGAELREIATHMGWSIMHAVEVIERYVALAPGMTDWLAEKLKRAESRTKNAK
ncbi:tyrosine-type recombinase/integrase [Paracoccus albus]|uniref:tyrosine-type recombinase/integrase n=1 Tax=Paracoccus albus TaxID=3017784 RepID=UPI0022F07300|nr:hypothetical protein [Paracoccus albus]WBU59014.1 hypothetical protein PAF20_09340 [Paracoccus albus]